jgi:tetratricopeptide (TPR) repeat protein
VLYNGVTRATRLAKLAPSLIKKPARILHILETNMLVSLETLVDRIDGLPDEIAVIKGWMRKAIQVAPLDPDMALTRVRKVLEQMVRDVYQRRCNEAPGTRPLENLIQRLVKDGHLPNRMDAYATAVRKLGNVGTHSFSDQVTQEDVYHSLTQLLTVVDWYIESEGSNRPSVPRAGDEGNRLYLAARYFLDKRTEEGNRRSIATYYQLLDKDPAFAPAWAGLAFAYHLLGVRGHASPTSASPKGKSAALQAIDLDDSLGEAHTALAVILLDYDWDFHGAERAFRRALELKPNYAVAHQLYGKYLACIGRHPEAIAAIRRAQELQPFATIVSATLGRHGFFYAREYDQAVQEFRKTIETDPTFWIAHYFLGWAYVFQGNLVEALTAFSTAGQLDDNPETLAGLGYVYAAGAQRTKAEEALHALTTLAGRRYVAPVNQAIVYIGLQDKDQAFTWLEKAWEEHSEWLCKLRVDPVFDFLRSDSRFVDLLRRVNVNW